MGFLDNLAGTRTIKQLYEGAERHAITMGDPTVGAEHLLLSALDLPDGDARRAFERAGADPDAVVPSIAAVHANALRSVGIQAPPEEHLRVVGSGRRRRPKPNESLIQVLKVAATMQKLEDVTSIGAQVVAACAGLEKGTVARTIAQLGVDRDLLAAAARAEGRKKAA